MKERPEFRTSQGVVPFGVGAIIDFLDESLMSAGLDAWPYELADPSARSEILKSSQVVDGRLARRLSVELDRPIDFFLSPTEAPEIVPGGAQRHDRADMPFVRFPNWHFCPRCRRLTHVPWNTPWRDKNSLRCQNSGRRAGGDAKPCSELPAHRRPRLSPVRFVAACEAGHIMDFPWYEWAHSGDEAACSPDAAKLYLYSTTAAGLAGVVVKCTTCNSSRSMAGAFQRDALSSISVPPCPGERPWLGPDGIVPCPSLVPQTIQRGASNSYFAKLVSSILIPPYSAKIQQALDRPDIWDEITSFTVDGKPHLPFLKTKARNLGLEEDAFIAAVLERLNGDGPTADAHTDETRYRFDEYKAYTGPRPPEVERHDFDVKPCNLSLYQKWFTHAFDAVVLVRRLRETRVLTGFTRLVPPDASGSALAELSLSPKRWLPGFSVRGEGIFLQFSHERLAAWQTNTKVVARVDALQDQLQRIAAHRGRPVRTITPAHLLIHSFAHLLIRQLAFECGYDSSSLRERLYVSSDPAHLMSGLLVYTASGDSEGTLGGLVRQGEPGRLDATVKAALANAAICSSDPLCIESEGQGTNALNRAACHACALLPETSCEEGNLLLDRVVAIGTPEKPDIGYFNNIDD